MKDRAPELPADAQALLPGFVRDVTGRRMRRRRVTPLSTAQMRWTAPDRPICPACFRIHLRRMNAAIATPWGSWQPDGSGPARLHTYCPHRRPDGAAQRTARRSEMRTHHHAADDPRDTQRTLLRAQANRQHRPTEQAVLRRLDEYADHAAYIAEQAELLAELGY